MADDTAEQERAGLEQRHEELEKRLADLDRHLSLTTEEQVERIRLKKEKLLVKDRLQLLGAATRVSAVG